MGAADREAGKVNLGALLERALEAEACSSGQRELIQTAQLAAVTQRFYTPVVANLLVLAVALLVLWSSFPALLLGAWAAAMLLVLALTLMLLDGPPGADAHGAAVPRLLRSAALCAALRGALWGCPIWILPLAAAPQAAMFFAFLAGGMAAGFVAVYSFLPWACACFILGSVVPLMAKLLIEPDPFERSMALILVCYAGLLATVVLCGYRNFVELVKKRAVIARLAGALVRETEKTEHTREQAERARDQAEETARLCREVLLHVTREVESPLNAALGWVRLARRKAVDPEQRSYLSRFEETAKCVRQTLQTLRRSPVLAATAPAAATRRPRAAAAAADGARSERALLAEMTHELRTPLNALLGLSQLALRKAVDGEQRAQLEKVQAAGKGLLRIIDHVLDFAKIEAGGLGIEQLPLTLRAILDGALDVVALAAEQKHIGLILAVDAAVPAELVGGSFRIGQVLTNLLSNAVKFTAAGSVTLRVVLAERKGEHVTLEFCVRDTGVGMTAAQQARLFQPFTQAELSTTRRFGGTGLGLSICKRLAEAMGGLIEVDSKLGLGSTFTLRLPLTAGRVPASAGAAAARGEEKTEQGALPLAGLRVLLAEDNDVNQEILEAMLVEAGAVVELADNGREAVTRIAAEPGRFDAVLLDVEMPEMSGPEATRLIRARKDASHLPVIALTAHLLDCERERCPAAGMDDYLVKPIERQALIDSLLASLAAARPILTDQRTS